MQRLTGDALMAGMTNKTNHSLHLLPLPKKTEAMRLERGLQLCIL